MSNLAFGVPLERTPTGASCINVMTTALCAIALPIMTFPAQAVMSKTNLLQKRIFKIFCIEKERRIAVIGSSPFLFKPLMFNLA